MPFRPLQQPTAQTQQTQEKQPGYFKRVGQQYMDITRDVISDVMRPDESRTKGASVLETIKQVGEAGLRTVGNVAKSAFVPIMQAPGIKQATDFVGEKVADTGPMKKFQEWSVRHPEAAKDITAVLDIAGLFGGKAAEAPLARGVASAGKAGSELVEGGIKTVSRVADKAASATKMAPSNIMTRVARLTPKEELAFKNTAGKSVGEYLTQTGNFGDPRSIVAKESEKFVSSKNMVDEALAKLPGEYRAGPVEDALELVIKKGEGSSTSSVKAPYLSRAGELLQKSKNAGLNMSEINEAKRLLEKEVRLGYNKMIKPQAVARATYVDDAIREWQFKKAPELGLNNLPELNKQTQISKFLINKLGDSLVGKEALNNVSLTDWIVLAGGDATAVGGYLVKKFFSSASIQAKIAKMLNRAPIQELITPK